MSPEHITLAAAEQAHNVALRILTPTGLAVTPSEPEGSSFFHCRNQVLARLSVKFRSEQ
jgi:hypothetical protein